MMRWHTYRWGRTWMWGVRRGEWWIGARRDFITDMTVFGIFGLTLMVGKQ